MQLSLTPFLSGKRKPVSIRRDVFRLSMPVARLLWPVWLVCCCRRSARSSDRTGEGIAINTSEFVGCVYLLIQALRKGYIDFSRPDLPIFSRIWRIGWPGRWLWRGSPSRVASWLHLSLYAVWGVFLIDWYFRGAAFAWRYRRRDLHSVVV